MTSVATAPSAQLSPDLSEAASRPVAARLQVRMGRAVSVGEGINWLTLVVLIVFHPVSYTHLDVYKRQSLVLSRFRGDRLRRPLPNPA